MSELIYILKCLVITAGITMALQLENKGITLERSIEYYLKSSPLVAWTQSAALGGAMALRNTSRYLNLKYREITKSDSIRPGQAQR